MITAIAGDAATARFLAWPGDFELDRADHVEEVRLASGVADLPDLPADRDRAAAALGLELPPAGEVLSRVRETASGAGPEFDLVFTPEGTTCERLIVA